LILAFDDSNKSLPEPGFVRKLDGTGRTSDIKGRASREDDALLTDVIL
jgi:hypothetical protein